MLYEKKGRTYVPVSDEAVVDRAKVIVSEKIAHYGVMLTNPSIVKDLLVLSLGGEVREHFEVLFLTSQNELLAHERLFSGTIGECAVWPREIMKRALELNAAAMIVAHNHPSGETVASNADRALTNRIVEASKLLNIRCLDHVIVGGSKAFSFAEGGLI